MHQLERVAALGDLDQGQFLGAIMENTGEHVYLKDTEGRYILINGPSRRRMASLGGRST